MAKARGSPVRVRTENMPSRTARKAPNESRYNCMGRLFMPGDKKQAITIMQQSANAANIRRLNVLPEKSAGSFETNFVFCAFIEE